MKRDKKAQQDDVELVVTNLEENTSELEEAILPEVDSDTQHAESDDTAHCDDARSVDGTDGADGDESTPVPDDVPVATTEEDAHERRSAWRLFSSEDLPQLTLREILGGDYLIGSFLRRNIWFILVLVLLGILYISNRYAAQQEIIEEEHLRNELVEKKNYALTQYATLTMSSRQSNIERKLQQMGDSLLKSATEPPFIIRIKK
ncbi:MAG: hypothetical protein IJ767_03460 [Bacteroidaceae bacterium]|nr:hypothetical protein [Bacteroidaceae bacterium]MBR1800536.1 hypothetical protein [Bacteroidaceae bacterium]